MNFIKGLLLAITAFVLSLFGVSAFAAPVDLTTLTAAVDFSSVITAVLAIAAILMGVYVAIKGVKITIQMVRGG